MIDLLLAAALIVTDGDTIRVGAERIRLVGLDAPELSSSCAAERDLANAARNRLQSLLRGGYEIERVPCAGRNFGRTCAIVRVNGVDVAQTLIAEQLARPYVCTDRCPRRQRWC